MSNDNSNEVFCGSRKRGADTSPTSTDLQSIQARKSCRRSAIFRKDAPSSEQENGSGSDITKSSSPIINQDQDSDFKSSGSIQGTQDHREEARISLSNYEKALQTEKEDWSLTRRARSDRYHKLAQQVKSRKFETISVESCAYSLSDEDKKFMSERPDYIKIAHSANALREEVYVALELRKKMLLEARTLISNFTTKLEVVDWEVANKD